MGNKIHENYPLLRHNTLRLDVSARFFTTVTSITDLSDLYQQEWFSNGPFIVIGEGSKVFFTKDYPGLVIRMSILGRELVPTSDDRIHIRVGAGENWAELVEFTVNQGWGGLENLADIPGTAGAAPVKNLEAYGQSIADVLHEVEVFDIGTGVLRKLTADECGLGYRTSMFRKPGGRDLIITSITLTLNSSPTLNIQYSNPRESIKAELDTFATAPYSVKDIFQAVRQIRRRKLPDIAVMGSAGSYFINPSVDEETMRKLTSKDAQLRCYPAGAGHTGSRTYRLPAGYLLEKIGWKGKRIGDCGTWDQQALVIVNYGNTSPEEIGDLATKMRSDFQERYNVALEEDVVVV